MAFSVFTAPGAGLASSSGGTLTLTRPSSGRKQKGALTVDSYYCKRLRPLFWWSPGGAASGVTLLLGHWAAPLRGFLLIVIMRFDYLSTQVITVHLLPPLPVSDLRHHRHCLLFSSALQVEADWLTG